MRSDLTRAALCALFPMLVLTACGGALEEAGPAPAEPLGTQQSALCSGASVSSLTISGVSSWGGELTGNGGWAVAYPANAVRLEYTVNGVLKGSEERCNASTQGYCTGSGEWYFSDTGYACGAHPFEVKAFPMVIDSAGNRTTCWSSPSMSASQSVTQNCPTASVSCSRTASTVTCTGSGTGGTGGYTSFWKEVYEGSATSWYQGTGPKSFYCPLKSGQVVWNDSLRVEFKVRDTSGMESPIASRTYLCAF